MSGGHFDRLDFHWGIGVDIFFVISGFIMAYTSRDLFGTKGGIQRFVTRRLIRIVPIYYFYTIAMIFAVLLFSKQLNSTQLEWDNVIASFLFFPDAVSSGKVRPLLGLGWTLNYEMFFYCIFSLGILFNFRKGIIFCLAILILLSLTGYFYNSGITALTFWTSSIIIEFGFGILLGTAYLYQRSIDDWALFLAALLFSLLLYLELQDSTAETPRFIYLGLPAFIFCGAIIWFMPRNLELWMKSIAIRLGDSSYSLYLSHPFSLGIFKLFWPFPHNGSALWLFIVAASLFAIFGGWLSYILIEKPMLEFLKKRVLL